MGKPEEAAAAVDDFDADAAPPGLVDDDARIGIEASYAPARRGEEALVDRVLALDREERHAHEAELLVERDRLLVVVQHRQVHVGQRRAP